MQCETTGQFMVDCENGRVPPGTRIYDESGTEYIKLSQGEMFNKYLVVRTEDGLVCSPWVMHYPVGVEG